MFLPLNSFMKPCWAVAAVPATRAAASEKSSIGRIIEVSFQGRGGSKDSDKGCRVCCWWLPVQNRREVLRDERLVVGLQSLHVRALLALGVKVVRVELADPVHQLVVALVHQVRVLPLTVGG